MSSPWQKGILKGIRTNCFLPTPRPGNKLTSPSCCKTCGFWCVAMIAYCKACTPMAGTFHCIQCMSLTVWRIGHTLSSPCTGTPAGGTVSLLVNSGLGPCFQTPEDGSSYPSSITIPVVLRPTGWAKIYSDAYVNVYASITVETADFLCHCTTTTKCYTTVSIPYELTLAHAHGCADCNYTCLSPDGVCSDGNPCIFPVCPDIQMTPYQPFAPVPPAESGNPCYAGVTYPGIAAQAKTAGAC